MLVLSLSWLAWAGGFYHPDDVAAASQRFATASDRSAPALEEAEAGLKAAAAALEAYEQALDALGDRAPDSERSRLAALREQYDKEYDALDAHANALVDGFDRSFTEAMEKALAGIPGPHSLCERTIPQGASLPGMPVRRVANPACTGDDLNEVVAKAMDTDPALARSLEDLLARPWPKMALPTEVMPPVGVGERYILVLPLVRSGAKAAWQKITENDLRRRDDLELMLQDSPSAGELEQIREKVRAINAQVRAERAALAGPILTACEGVLAKRKDGSAAWCANPLALGGCQGQDATDALVPELLGEKKVQKVLPGN